MTVPSFAGNGFYFGHLVFGLWPLGSVFNQSVKPTAQFSPGWSEAEPGDPELNRIRAREVGDRRQETWRDSDRILPN